jgi:RimJ/RimL family protein N-acetyltransferase
MIRKGNLILRRAVKADIPKALKWQANEEMVYLTGVPRLSLQEDLERELSQPFPNRLIFIIQIKDTAIGYLALSNIRWKDRSGQFGIIVGEKDYWNKLYGANVYVIFLDYAFNTLNMNKIYGIVPENNQRHIRLIEKGGGKKEGILKEHIFKDGRYYDVYMYGFLQRDYLEGKKESQKGIRISWLWRKTNTKLRGLTKE